MISQLSGITEKRFFVLNNVIKFVSGPDRILEDERYPDINRDSTEDDLPVADDVFMLYQRHPYQSISHSIIVVSSK